MKTTSILLIIVGVVIVWFVFAYNKFIRLITRAKEAWSDIEVQMKRRYDLIPNLVETVKGYAAHEQGTLDRVIQARNSAMNAKGNALRAQAENELTGTLKTIFALSEAYPDLKANTNFLELQRELTDTEDKIQAARRFYNTNVRDLNISIDVFPSSIVAKIFGFNKMEFFELGEEEAAAREPVQVKF